MAQHSQPMVLRGCRATMTAPTIPKGMNASRDRISWLRSSCSAVSPLTIRAALPSATKRKPAPTGTMLSVRIDQATQVQRLSTGLHRLLRVSDRGACVERRSTAAPSRDRYDPRHAPSTEPSNALLQQRVAETGGGVL